ncbi:MAG: helix-turn-helix transcriptional regulator [Chthonomonas sp.]|nr:helix-turn-helix transcriptional regulator [Chthonomonas sp.]
MKELVVTLSLDRPADGPVWTQGGPRGQLCPSREPAWRGEGVLRAKLPVTGGKLDSLWLNFAVPEPHGREATLFEVAVFRSGQRVFRKSIRTTHLRVAGSSGDGIAQHAVGCVAMANSPHWPVHDLNLQVGRVEGADEIHITPRCPLLVFDLYAELRSEVGCPFHSHSAGVSLAELGSVIRIGDRRRFDEALAQLRRSLSQSADLDEARGLALTFLAVIAAALLELGAPRSLHRHQLDMARQLDGLTSLEAVITLTSDEATKLLAEVVPVELDDTPPQIAAALEFLDRQFAQPLNDSDVADQVGLSTSHFRYLFRQATGEPFQKYLLRLRLEKARLLLQDHNLTVSEVTHMVGFVSAAHFTRSFSRRFGYSPSQVR